MKPLVSMREALTDPNLLGGAIEGDSWLPWRTLLIAAMGEPLNQEERTIYTALTQRDLEPLEQVEELWGIVGRRGGKTRAAGTLAAYVGGLCDHAPFLAPGERGVIPILAASVTQAGRAFMHAKGILQHSPVLADLIEGEPTADTIRLSTLVDIEVKPANFRTVRSITAVAAIADEIAFWQIEGAANPDSEILNALRPSLATTGGPLFVISSPYAKRGELYGTFRRDYGANGDPVVLVAKGASREFNSTLPQRVVDRAYARDAAAAASEYGGEFRNDVQAFIDRDVVDACVSQGVTERRPVGWVTYFAFVDPSGGSNDAMTLAIGHADGEMAVLDAVRERKPPFSPEAVVEDFCGLLNEYGITEVTGDRYAGEWPRERFRKNGIAYNVADRPRSDLYRDMLPGLNSRTADLLDNPMLVTQIVGLERRVARGGKESIDHAPNGHDDLANAVAGVLSLIQPRKVSTVAMFLKSGRRDAPVGKSARVAPRYTSGGRA
ncbi:hypothetical protein [Brevundimonas sp. SPF441]|uniref:hypothetical protein n=1 Tax=Brevundimonas sp. SPF441 TaxID=2663795 RepID=UPI001892B15E|nr:hypothetical protein [Brevundimonas sp. SPF441]